MILHFFVIIFCFCFQDDTRFMLPVPALYKVQNLVMVIVKVVSISPGRQHALKLIKPDLHPSHPSVSLHHLDLAFRLRLKT